ncbi:uncharacterized protein MONOS_81 [Monocercomonoides exilis]|uniref:uncharacterized protein n=1 Tax=Monocercomonoides exilis TaxID=2049356 RepID=UPI003559C42D|nr:hypothetical protein MONOS_81 [Monocercomonoides exilis]|eukprot:MONOS_81.1-p1 / transcript=MONOS_81.1 / gene=MONOS_81 / organism=Monocercomonoides_exilis_PA203 / gene_product=unspecified product / transcript_product=unspecified product / location=Mono_scaffold00002:6016-8335(-) / protein_length=656 / sequence_SO=supercontig / SO=protein_coding / is_pseudo=false
MATSSIETQNADVQKKMYAILWEKHMKRQENDEKEIKMEQELKRRQIQRQKRSMKRFDSVLYRCDHYAKVPTSRSVNFLSNSISIMPNDFSHSLYERKSSEADLSKDAPYSLSFTNLPFDFQENHPFGSQTSRSFTRDKQSRNSITSRSYTFDHSKSIDNDFDFSRSNSVQYGSVPRLDNMNFFNEQSRNLNFSPMTLSRQGTTEDLTSSRLYINPLAEHTRPPFFVKKRVGEMERTLSVRMNEEAEKKGKVFERDVKEQIKEEEKEEEELRKEWVARMRRNERERNFARRSLSLQRSLLIGEPFAQKKAKKMAEKAHLCDSSANCTVATSASSPFSSSSIQSISSTNHFSPSLRSSFTSSIPCISQASRTSCFASASSFPSRSSPSTSAPSASSSLSSLSSISSISSAAMTPSSNSIYSISPVFYPPTSKAKHLSERCDTSAADRQPFIGKHFTAKTALRPFSAPRAIRYASSSSISSSSSSSSSPTAHSSSSSELPEHSNCLSASPTTPPSFPFVSVLPPQKAVCGRPGSFTERPMPRNYCHRASQHPTVMAQPCSNEGDRCIGAPMLPATSDATCQNRRQMNIQSDDCIANSSSAKSLFDVMKLRMLSECGKTPVCPYSSEAGAEIRKNCRSYRPSPKLYGLVNSDKHYREE